MAPTLPPALPIPGQPQGQWCSSFWSSRTNQKDSLEVGSCPATRPSSPTGLPQHSHPANSASSSSAFLSLLGSFSSLKQGDILGSSSLEMPRAGSCSLALPITEAGSSPLAFFWLFGPMAFNFCCSSPLPAIWSPGANPAQPQKKASGQVRPAGHAKLEVRAARLPGQLSSRNREKFWLSLHRPGPPLGICGKQLRCNASRSSGACQRYLLQGACSETKMGLWQPVGCSWAHLSWKKFQQCAHICARFHPRAASGWPFRKASEAPEGKTKA